MPPFFTALGDVFAPAISMMAVGLMETLMTQQIMDDITNMPTSPNREVRRGSCSLLQQLCSQAVTLLQDQEL